MTAALTYTSLVEDIKVYADRSDAPFVDQIPRFIMLAENRIASEVRGLGFQKYANGTLNSNTIEKPARWRETFSLNITVGTERRFLRERSYEYCRAYAPTPATTDVPKYYANYDYEHFFIAPTPDANYAFELGYYERPEPLSELNETSWTTRYAPQLLLFASLVEAQPFLKRPERIKEFIDLFDRARAAVEKESTRRLQDRASVRTSE